MGLRPVNRERINEWIADVRFKAGAAEEAANAAQRIGDNAQCGALRNISQALTSAGNAMQAVLATLKTQRELSQRPRPR
jgi:hypothetical protein